MGALSEAVRSDAAEQRRAAYARYCELLVKGDAADAAALQAVMVELGIKADQVAADEEAVSKLRTHLAVVEKCRCGRNLEEWFAQQVLIYTAFVRERTLEMKQRLSELISKRDSASNRHHELASHLRLAGELKGKFPVLASIPLPEFEEVWSTPVHEGEGCDALSVLRHGYVPKDWAPPVPPPAVTPEPYEPPTIIQEPPAPAAPIAPPEHEANVEGSLPADVVLVDASAPTPPPPAGAVEIVAAGGPDRGLSIREVAREHMEGGNGTGRRRGRR